MVTLRAAMSALPSGEDASTLVIRIPGNHSPNSAMTRDVPHAVQPLSFMTVTLMGTIPWRSHEDSGVPGLRHRDSLPGTAQSATVEQAICGICGACASCFWASRVSFVAFNVT